MALQEKVQDCTITCDMNVGGETIWMGMETWETGVKVRFSICQKETCYFEYYFKNEE